MTTNTDTPRSHLTEHTPAGEPDHASRHIPIGSYTDDPAVNARHSADIADMMADRSRGSADRAAASAATALNTLRLAELAADKAVLAADRSPHTVRTDRVSAEKILCVVGIIVIVVVTEILCAITIYAVARPVFAAIDSLEYTPNAAQWTAPPPKGFDATPDVAGGARP